MSDPIMDALSSSGDFAPVFKFANPGDSITGIIIDEPVTLPLIAYGSTEPKIGKDGNPVMQVMVVLATEQFKDENHDGRWRVYIDKPLLKSSVRDALIAAGAATLKRGGKLGMTHTGFKQLGSGQAKDFASDYDEPTSDADGPLGIGELGETGDAFGDRPVA